MNDAQDEPERAGYRRSAGSPRGAARKEDLLDRVTADLVANGLVDFSLRRAARAAGTTHKVLLYHFDGVEDLLTQAVLRLRGQRIEGSVAAAAEAAATRGGRLSERVAAMWPVLTGPGSALLDQVIGLSMYDTERYAGLSRSASEQYLPALRSVCPAHWSEQRKDEVAELILASLRGFLVDHRTSADAEGIAAGFAALRRALDREEAAG